MTVSGPAYDPAYLRFIELFNAGRFEESHEELIGAWRQDPRDDFYKGLIQLAGAFQHASGGNPFWARDLLASSHNLLAKYAPVHRGLDVDDLCEKIRALHAVLEAQGGESASLPELRLTVKATSN